MPDKSIDPILWNDWHVVAEVASLQAARPLHTTLLDTPLTVSLGEAGPTVIRADAIPVHMTLRYGFVWACLGTPMRDVVDIPEAAEDWRYVVTSGAFGVHASAPRLIENFLDLGHLPYVHQGYLGAEPETEIRPYQVDRLPEGGIIATGCKIYQPVASPAAKQGFVVDYIYKVVRPLVVCLYKANPVHTGRFDIIYLFVQPVSEERTIASLLVLFGKEGTTVGDLRWFQQLIFLQDKPILENQFPKKLPLGPRMEMPILADKSSVAYRRWLAEIGLRYGTIGLDDGAETLAA